ncbi:NAD(P)-binding protein [Lophiostoma macrostomum CBS 122681]|uniref:NAD(P)-binding protein n=1 Tax=Lophiostoma macrostomum CBS 122681 TaxID=1314788 RepID=A0A6A6TBD5_9PLEO|nr:NAD(P)-binding protein [Lophiostoma macrostomum CBS 122681]
MHLFFLGATGRTGVHGYNYALEQGHHVTIIVRKASDVEPHEGLTVVEGSVLSAPDVERAVAARGVPVDAALVFLNSRRTSDNPWAKFVGPAHLIADGTANVAQALRKQERPPTASKPRLVVMSAIGVGESQAMQPMVTRFIVNHSNIGKTYEDHNAMNSKIEENCGTAVDWTVVFPVALNDAGDKPVKVFGPTESGAAFFISRESCAKWMVEVATGKLGDQFRNKRAILSN